MIAGVNQSRSAKLVILILIAIFTGCQSDVTSQVVLAESKDAEVSSSTLVLPPPAVPTSAQVNPPAAATATITSTLSPSLTPTPEFTATQLPTLTPQAAPFFDRFVAAIMNEDATKVVGVYVENVLALKVVQQPANNPAFVSGVRGVATYFAMVRKQTGNTGLLAHNYLAGIYYYDLQPGQIVVLIYGDGRTEDFIVENSEQFQALNPTSPTSSFVNVLTGEKLSSTSLFKRVYGGGYKTTFQTCIAQGKDASWGRLFVIAPQD